MNKIVLKKKKNNAGSTIVIVLLMTSFVLILSTLITTTTLINLKMKIAASQSSKSFYTAEEAIDEVRASLGVVSINCFNTVYENKMTKISSSITTTVEESGVTESKKEDIDNDNLNKEFREEYTEKLLKDLELIKNDDATKIPINTTDLGKRCDDDKPDSELTEDEKTYRKFIKRLNDAIEDKAELESKGKNLEVVSVSSLRFVKGVSSSIGGAPTYTVQFKDCVVKYLDETNDNYSYVTFDGTIGMPDIKIDFKEDEMVGTLFFANYCLVGNGGINLASGSSSIGGSAYAGSGSGLVIGSDNTSQASLTTSGEYLVCGGNIKIGGKDNKNKSSLISSSQIWANNFDVDSFVDVTCNGSVNLQDDLTVNGSYSKVHINNSFYGFGYEGLFTGTASPQFSSAVIVNGKHSGIDFSKSTYKLYVAGRAYIKPEDDKALATGESLSINVRQEIYLIPSSLLSGAKKNPVKYHEGESPDIQLNITPKNFFAYYMLATNADGKIEYEFRKDSIGKDSSGENDYNGYYYFKFKDNSSKNEYANAILNYSDSEWNNYLNGLYSAHSSEIGNKTIFLGYANTLRNSVRETIKGYKTDSDSDLTEGGNKSIFSSNAVSDEEMTKISTDRGARYSVFNKILAPLTKDIETTEYDEKAIQRELSTYNHDPYYININLGRYTPGEVFDNIINMGETGFPAFTKGTSVYTNEEKSIKVVVCNDDLTVGSNTSYPSSKCLVISSGNVTVSGSFDGIILARKVVYLDNGSSVSSGITYSELENFFKDGGEGAGLSKNGILLRDIFRYWNSKTVKRDGTLTVDSMTYRDMIGVSQWRKYYDEEKYSE